MEGGKTRDTKLFLLFNHTPNTHLKSRLFSIQLKIFQFKHDYSRKLMEEQSNKIEQKHTF